LDVGPPPLGQLHGREDLVDRADHGRGTGKGPIRVPHRHGSNQHHLPGKRIPGRGTLHGLEADLEPPPLLGSQTRPAPAAAACTRGCAGSACIVSPRSATFRRVPPAPETHHGLIVPLAAEELVLLRIGRRDAPRVDGVDPQGQAGVQPQYALRALGIDLAVHRRQGGQPVHGLPDADLVTAGGDHTALRLVVPAGQSGVGDVRLCARFGGPQRIGRHIQVGVPSELRIDLFKRHCDLGHEGPLHPCTGLPSRTSAQADPASGLGLRRSRALGPLAQPGQFRGGDRSQSLFHLPHLATEQGIGQQPVPLKDLNVALKLLLQLQPGIGLQGLAGLGGQAILGHADGDLQEQRRQDQRRQRDRQEKHKQTIAYRHLDPPQRATGSTGPRIRSRSWTAWDYTHPWTA